MASVSPKHDTHPLIVASGRFSVSILAGDQVEQGQYFSYPGRKLRYVADEYLDDGRRPAGACRDCIAWLACEVEDRITGRYDHDLFFARVTAVAARAGWRSRRCCTRRALGWRVTGGRAREPGGVGPRPPPGPRSTGSRVGDASS